MDCAVLAKKILNKEQLQSLYSVMFIGKYLGKLGKFGQSKTLL